jgi:hypothetical protein
MIWRRPRSWVRLVALLAASVAFSPAAHSKAPSIEPLAAVFETTAPGTIEASLDPPIIGVLRIVVQAGASETRPQPGGSDGLRSHPSTRQPLTLEVTQSGRPIPFRLVSQSGRHQQVGGRPPLLVAEIDVNDLTPGLPVRIRIHSNLDDPPELEGHAFAVVY